MDNSKVFAMKLSKVYPLLVQKAERKHRTREEVDVDYGTFFREAPCFHPNAAQITGAVCGVRVEDIPDPLMQKIRYLDKLIDELAKGRTMERILRK